MWRIPPPPGPPYPTSNGGMQKWESQFGARTRCARVSSARFTRRPRMPGSALVDKKLQSRSSGGSLCKECVVGWGGGVPAGGGSAPPVGRLPEHVVHEPGEAAVRLPVDLEDHTRVLSRARWLALRSESLQPACSKRYVGRSSIVSNQKESKSGCFLTQLISLE